MPALRGSNWIREAYQHRLLKYLDVAPSDELDCEYVVDKIVDSFDTCVAALPNTEDEMLTLLNLFQDFTDCFKLDFIFQSRLAKCVLSVATKDTSSINILKTAVNVLNKSFIPSQQITAWIATEDSIEKLVNMFGKRLFTIGDYECQAAFVEAMCYISNHSKMHWPEAWFSNNVSRHLFCNIRPEQFEKDLRRCLNSVNHRQEKGNGVGVYSFTAEEICFDTYKLRKPCDMEFWIDLNYGTKTISFYCSELRAENDSSSDWETVVIESSIVKSYSISKDPGGIKLELSLFLNCPCSELIHASYEVPKTKTNLVKISYFSYINISVHLDAVLDNCVKGILKTSNVCDVIALNNSAIQKCNSKPSSNQTQTSHPQKSSNSVHIIAFNIADDKLEFTENYEANVVNEDQLAMSNNREANSIREGTLESPNNGEANLVEAELAVSTNHDASSIKHDQLGLSSNSDANLITEQIHRKCSNSSVLLTIDNKAESDEVDFIEPTNELIKSRIAEVGSRKSSGCQDLILVRNKCTAEYEINDSLEIRPTHETSIEVERNESSVKKTEESTEADCTKATNEAVNSGSAEAGRRKSSCSQDPVPIDNECTSGDQERTANTMAVQKSSVRLLPNKANKKQRAEPHILELQIAPHISCSVEIERTTVKRPHKLKQVEPNSHPDQYENTVGKVEDNTKLESVENGTCDTELVTSSSQPKKRKLFNPHSQPVYDKMQRPKKKHDPAEIALERILNLKQEQKKKKNVPKTKQKKVTGDDLKVCTPLRKELKPRGSAIKSMKRNKSILMEDNVNILLEQEDFKNYGIQYFKSNVSKNMNRKSRRKRMTRKSVFLTDTETVTGSSEVSWLGGRKSGLFETPKRSYKKRRSEGAPQQILAAHQKPVAKRKLLEAFTGSKSSVSAKTKSAYSAMDDFDLVVEKKSHARSAKLAKELSVVKRAVEELQSPIAYNLRKRKSSALQPYVRSPEGNNSHETHAPGRKRRKPSLGSPENSTASDVAPTKAKSITELDSNNGADFPVDILSNCSSGKSQESILSMLNYFRTIPRESRRADLSACQSGSRLSGIPLADETFAQFSPPVVTRGVEHTEPRAAEETAGARRGGGSSVPRAALSEESRKTFR